MRRRPVHGPIISRSNVKKERTQKLWYTAGWESRSLGRETRRVDARATATRRLRRDDVLASMPPHAHRDVCPVFLAQFSSLTTAETGCKDLHPIYKLHSFYKPWLPNGVQFAPCLQTRVTIGQHAGVAAGGAGNAAPRAALDRHWTRRPGSLREQSDAVASLRLGRRHEGRRRARCPRSEAEGLQGRVHRARLYVLSPPAGAVRRSTHLPWLVMVCRTLRTASHKWGFFSSFWDRIWAE